MKSKTGMYDRRITLMYPSGSTDSNTGEPIYVDGAPIWAAFDVKPPAGRVVQINNEMEKPIQTRWIKIRYFSGIDASWRIKYVSTVIQMFEINQPPIDMNMQHRELYLELKAM